MRIEKLIFYFFLSFSKNPKFHIIRVADCRIAPIFPHVMSKFISSSESSLLKDDANSFIFSLTCCSSIARGRRRGIPIDGCNSCKHSHGCPICTNFHSEIGGRMASYPLSGTVSHSSPERNWVILITLLIYWFLLLT